jgi:hypothetical protein
MPSTCRLVWHFVIFRSFDYGENQEHELEVDVVPIEVLELLAAHGRERSDHQKREEDEGDQTEDYVDLVGDCCKTSFEQIECRLCRFDTEVHGDNYQTH